MQERLAELLEEFQSHDAALARIAELEAALRGVVPYTHADEQRVLLRRGIGTATPSGRAWLAVFAALGEPVKSKK